MDHHNGVETVVVDQRQDSGQFKRLGTFTYTAGVEYAIRLNDLADGYVIADAVRLVRIQEEPEP